MLRQHSSLHGAHQIILLQISLQALRECRTLLFRLYAKAAVSGTPSPAPRSNRVPRRSHGTAPDDRFRFDVTAIKIAIIVFVGP